MDSCLFVHIYIYMNSGKCFLDLRIIILAKSSRSFNPIAGVVNATFKETVHTSFKWERKTIFRGNLS